MNKLNTNSLFDIQVFVLLYESLNATIVSQVLGVPASKVSRSLKSIRHSLDAPLFIRKQQGFERSSFADDIYPKMKKIVQLAKKCAEIDIDQDKARKRELIIACPPTLSLNLLRHLQKRASAENEDYVFHIKSCNSNIGELLKQQRVDIAVTYSAYNTEQLSSTLIVKSDAYVMVARHGHPLLTANQPLLLSDIIDHPYISFAGNEQEDITDPLECYALDTNSDLNVVAKVCLLADLMLQLEHSNAIALLCYKDAIEFLCQRGDIAALELDYSICKLINQRSGHYHHYITQTRKSSLIPTWLSHEIQTYIKGNMTLPAGG
ncbi:LysR family transcriptional regulator [Shewanella gelidimarina]|uniref:LysR family transcriptional regulator n=1 Tax=Shewanella gelidimarina TaxID=56813 RepID=UPI0020106E4C|nr:LysR family transcriptional regulator [Shewanella gelidimarina]MCL1057306.1 LysR family transcriptional regulator [Shewanella gelidimarina]